MPLSLVAPRATDDACDFPGLDRIADRIGNALGDMLTRLGSPQARIAPPQVTVETISDWQGQVAGSGLCAFDLKSHNGSFAVALCPQLVARLVDRFYGGLGDAGRPNAGSRHADQRMIGRIGRLWTEALPSIWTDIALFSPRVVAESGDNLFANADQSARLVVHRYVVAIGQGEPCTLSWAYPVSILRQMPELARHNSADQTAGRDPQWQARLAAAVNEVSLPVRTIFARPELPVSQLLALKPGDIIPICLPSSVPVTVGGRVFAEGTVGESGGRTAIRISRILEGAIENERF